MIGIQIDEKFLRLAKASEIEPGKTFYLKNDDGSFSRCCIEPSELASQRRRDQLRSATISLSKQNRLYFRRDMPGKSFAE